jgi:hypothetical protein
MRGAIWGYSTRNAEPLNRSIYSLMNKSGLSTPMLWF